MAFSFGSGATHKLDNTTGRATLMTATARTVYARIVVNSASSAARDILNFTSPGVLWHGYFGFGTGGTNVLNWGYEDDGFGFHTLSWTTGFAAGSEHVVVGTYDGANLKIYADTDGVAKATQATTSTPIGGSSPTLLVGNHPSSTTQSFDGLIKELAWFSYALPPGLIMRLGAGDSPLLLPIRPLAYWDFRKDGRDRGRAALHLTASGATLVPHAGVRYSIPRQQWVNRVEAVAAGGATRVVNRQIMIGVG